MLSVAYLSDAPRRRLISVTADSVTADSAWKQDETTESSA